MCGSAATLAGNGTTTITIAFPACAGGTVTVAQAVRAGAFGNPATAAVASVSDPNSTNPDESVILPNAPNGGATQHPDLISATIGADNDSIVYTFDKNVVVAPGGGVGTFRAELAVGGSPAISTGAVGSGSNDRDRALQRQAVQRVGVRRDRLGVPGRGSGRQQPG